MTETTQLGGAHPIWSLTDFLAVLGGADLSILEKAKSTKPGFVGLGLVMLATAAVATMSMGFALTGPLKAPPAIAVPLAFCWGAIILIIDRYLVKSMQGVRAKGTILAMAVPRVIMAAIIGVVVSTPITLRIFEPEILAQVALDRLDQQKVVGERMTETPASRELVTINNEIAALEGVKNGQGDPPATAALTAAQDALKAAQSDRDALQKQADNVYLKRACEEAGAGLLPQCQGLSSGEVGQGPRWRALDEEYKRVSGDLDKANGKVNLAQTNVDTARTEAVKAAQSTMDQQVKNAQMRLCGTEDMTVCDGGLMKRKAELEQQIIRDKGQAESQVIQNEGMIAQLSALNKISSAGENRTGFLVHTAVFLFFFMIEILPVTVKTMVALGGDHQYDDVADRMKQAELVAARSAYDTESLRLSNQDTKRVAIENDMVQREISLGKLANEHVQNEMEIILKAALERWSKDLKDAMANNPTKQGNTQPSQPSQPADPNNLAAKQGRI